MQKTIIAIIIVLVVGFGIYFIVANNNNSNSQNNLGQSPTYNSNTPPTNLPSDTTSPPINPPTTPTPISNTPPAPSSVTVSIKNFAFNPPTLTVKVGTKVTWINNDSVPHTVTSDSGSELASSTLSTGATYSHTFNTAGSFPYHCSIHTTMHGTVTVS